MMPVNDGVDILQLAEAVGVEFVREELIGHYIELLKDNEAEVRTAAAGQVPGGFIRDIYAYMLLSNPS